MGAAGGGVQCLSASPADRARAHYLPEQEADPRTFHGKVAEAEAHDRLLDWVAGGKVTLDEWVSHEMLWDQYRHGFEMVKIKTANKVALTCQ